MAAQAPPQEATHATPGTTQPSTARGIGGGGLCGVTALGRTYASLRDRHLVAIFWPTRIRSAFGMYFAFSSCSLA
ncbi:hypothetical protein H4696_007654 [Amycolatopsis lexingtonensis]|uniref:Uncharacterized protein n=1 Tax=Amycolatopsis lexingtonensis TaxID=218822 RepID=A0ABR9IBJ8_9PSEU|nr:hypothetical protein [Amycolatopsis lexingtonensis]